MTKFSGIDLKNPEESIKEEIEQFVAVSPGNKKPLPEEGPYFEKPLVGFASACDPLFEAYKEIIGDFHLTPIEILSKLFPEHSSSWDKASVISWILPISSSTRQSNRKQTRGPSPAWEQTRIHGGHSTISSVSMWFHLLQSRRGLLRHPCCLNYLACTSQTNRGFVPTGQKDTRRMLRGWARFP